MGRLIMSTQSPTGDCQSTGGMQNNIRSTAAVIKMLKRKERARIPSPLRGNFRHLGKFELPYSTPSRLHRAVPVDTASHYQTYVQYVN